MEALRGHTSGYAIPTYVVDAPGGGGKVPLLPNYVVSQGQDKVVLRNFEGYITTYSEPTEYKRPKKTQWIPEPREEPGQSGVAGLLRGEQMVIRPEGWHDAHMRGQELDITSEDLEEMRDRPSIEVVRESKDKKAAKWKQVN